MSAVKYTFDNDFDSGSGGSVRPNKIEIIRDEAFTQGQENGRAEALNSIEQSCDNLLHNILTAAENLSQRQDELTSIMNKESAKLAFAIISKLAPASIEKKPLPEIELLIQECLKNIPLEPRLVIRVDDSLLPILQEKIEAMRLSSGYPGQIILLGEPMNHISDCRVEWANGGAERDFNSLLGEVETVVQNFITAPDTPPESENSHYDTETGTLSETIITQ